MINMIDAFRGDIHQEMSQACQCCGSLVPYNPQTFHNKNPGIMIASCWDMLPSKMETDTYWIEAIPIEGDILYVKHRKNQIEDTEYCEL